MSWRQILLNNCWRKMRHWHQEKGHHFSSLALESLISVCSFAQPLGHVLIGQFNLSVCRTGVGEFIPGVGVLQVPPNSTDLWWDLKVTVLLRNHLSVERNMMLVYDLNQSYYEDFNKCQVRASCYMWPTCGLYGFHLNCMQIVAIESLCDNLPHF